MSGKSNTKWKETMLKRFGSEEALSEYMRNNALKAQASWKENGKQPRGFSCSHDKAVEAGRKGGEHRLGYRKNSKNDE